MSANSLLVATAELRWFKKARKPFSAGGESVLQQYWSDPLGASGKGEWRDVPCVTESKQGVTEPPTLEN